MEAMSTQPFRGSAGSGKPVWMLFSSVTLLFFFLPFALGLHAMAGRRGRNAVLLLASLVFYGWSEGRVIVVLLLSIAVNYAFGRALARSGSPGFTRLRVISRNTPGEIPSNGPGK
jgi:hypothetical protein